MKLETNNIQTISSREVAEMLDTQHNDLLKKIRKINDDFRKGNISFSEFWIESTYKVKGNNKNYNEFQITKKGCQFLAHKNTGTKGNLFTARYMKKFEEMEATLKEKSQPQLPTTYLEALKALVVAEEEKERLNIENNHKQQVINTFSKDIPLAEKRQRINQIIRFNAGKCPERYALLYSEFEKKFHISLSKRMKSTEVLLIKPKIQNKMDLIDRVLGMTDELFELAVTLFEADYQTILKKIEEAR